MLFVICAAEAGKENGDIAMLGKHHLSIEQLCSGFLLPTSFSQGSYRFFPLITPNADGEKAGTKRNSNSEKNSNTSKKPRKVTTDAPTDCEVVGSGRQAAQVG